MVGPAEHSLSHQARDASYHPGCSEKRNFRVNGDGFGVAWYHHNKLEKGPCTVHFASPAWHSRNLRNICRFVESSTIMGHVRAAFSGVAHDTEGSTFGVRVSEENCHPFVYKRYAFCHNGGITGFPSMKRRIQQSLSDEAFSIIEGNTDSEHCFAIFLDQLRSMDEQMTAEEIATALRKTIRKIIDFSKACGVGDRPSSFNFAVTDGAHVVATRFRNGGSEPPSLYYCYGSYADGVEEPGGRASPGLPQELAALGLSPKKGAGSERASVAQQGSSAGRGSLLQRALEGSRSLAVERIPCGDTLIISSEPLTRSEDNWVLVPKNSIIIASGCTESPESPICEVRIDKMWEEEDQGAQLGAASDPRSVPQETSMALPIFASSPIGQSLLGSVDAFRVR